MNLPTLDELLALDALCLRDPNGGPLDRDAHRFRLEEAMTKAQFAQVRREGVLVAYGYMWPIAEDDWFVGGFSIHPDHRNAGVTARLFNAFGRLATESGVGTLHSHVLKGNAPSMRLHRRLGFSVAQENDRAVAFVARIEALRHTVPLRH